MSLKISTALANYLAVTGSMKGALDGGKMYVYAASAIPDTADEALSGATLLATVTESGDGSTGLTYESTASNGVIQKSASEVWKTLAANITAGTALFYRFCVGSDDGSGAAGASDYRTQGSIGTDISFDLTVPSTALSTGADFGPLSSFGYEIPLSPAA